MTDDELIEALRARLGAMTNNYERWVFLGDLLTEVGYCVHCGGRLRERGGWKGYCPCQRDD